MSKLALSSKSRHRSDARSGCASSVAARRWRRGPRQFCAVGARRRSTQRRSGAWESGQPRLGQLGSDSGEIRCACAPLAHRCASGAATRSAAAHSSGEREGREGVLERWRRCAARRGDERVAGLWPQHGRRERLRAYIISGVSHGALLAGMRGASCALGQRGLWRGCSSRERIRERRTECDSLAISFP